MTRLRLMSVVAALTLLGAATAEAAPGYSTADVNMRTGPDTDFPSVGVVPDGDPVEIAGCLRDESWCDVIWAGNRGWVYSEYLAFESRRGDYVPLPDVGPAAYGVPIVTFVARDYWDRYYVGRPWYANRAHWYVYTPRPRVGWIAPPPGKRVPGWWRHSYRAPVGMGPPPEHWNRHDRKHDRHDDRHDNRHDDKHDKRHKKGDWDGRSR